MITSGEAAFRVGRARAYAQRRGLLYVPCFQKAADGTYDPRPLDAPEALKLLVRVKHVPANTIERWWTGHLLDDLQLSLCMYCRCNPVAGELGACWWCEKRPWVADLQIRLPLPEPTYTEPAYA